MIVINNFYIHIRNVCTKTEGRSTYAWTIGRPLFFVLNKFTSYTNVLYLLGCIDILGKYIKEKWWYHTYSCGNLKLYLLFHIPIELIPR